MIAIWSGFWPLNCDIGTVILDHLGHLGHDVHTMLAFWANMGPVTLVDGGVTHFGYLSGWGDGGMVVLPIDNHPGHQIESRPAGPLGRAAHLGIGWKPTKMRNEWIIAWWLLFIKAEWLDDCYFADISVFDLISRWWFQRFFSIHPDPWGFMIQFHYRIFFERVETTN